MTEELATNALSENVFVYGSLRKGEKNHSMIENFPHVFLGWDKIRGDLYPTDFGFPFVLEGLGLVSGEIYAVTPVALDVLDTFESHPRMYERRMIKTTSGLDVWVYFGTGIQRFVKES